MLFQTLVICMHTKQQFQNEKSDGMRGPYCWHVRLGTCTDCGHLTSFVYQTVSGIKKDIATPLKYFFRRESNKTVETFVNLILTDV